METKIIPIQVADEGVIIPKIYLHEADEVEAIVTDDYILVRPKSSTPESTSETATVGSSGQFDFIGIGHTRNPSASIEAEEILEREIKRESGWSLD